MSGFRGPIEVLPPNHSLRYSTTITREALGSWHLCTTRQGEWAVDKNDTTRIKERTLCLGLIRLLKVDVPLFVLLMVG